MHRLALVGLGLGLATLACAASSKASRDPRVARLCGTWQASSDDEIVEERWLPSDEGLVGEGVTIDGQGRRTIQESLAIVVRADATIYRALPRGAEDWTEFMQTRDYMWSDPNHDFPRVIHYEFSDADHVHVSAVGVTSSGDHLQLDWSFVRVGPCPE